MAKSKPNNMPHFESLDQLVEFFDTHDLGEYWDEMPETHFEVDIKRKVHLDALDSEAADKLTEIQDKLKRMTVHIRLGNAKDGLKLWKELKAKYPEDKNMISNEPGVLIDIGGMLESERIVMDGISKGESFLDENMSDDQRAILHYNIANGYLSIFEIRPHEDLSSRLGNDNLQNAKYHLRQALNLNPKGDLKVNILVNYGNCLDSLGRGMEALYSYDDALEIDPNHSMAIGNRALAKLFLADISGAYRTRTYIEVYQELKSIIDKDDMLRIGGVSAREIFRDEMLRIESLFEDKTILGQRIDCSRGERKDSTEFEREYFDFFHEHKLFLNFHTGSHDCQNAILDSAFISIVTAVNEDARFYSLAKKINDIKEDFLAAKLLLAQSRFRSDALDTISRTVTFANTSDHADSNIYSALLKSAFRICYNILDKVAFFINDYLELKMKNSRIDFNTIWWEDPKTILFSMELELQEDLENGDFSEQLRQQFVNNNVPLPQNVTIRVKEGQDMWEIHDEGGRILYAIKKEDDSLNTYPKTKAVKKRIRETNNISLDALYDMRLDFNRDRRLGDLRNSMTHRKLTIYNSALTDWDDREDSENIGYDRMFSETVRLMKLVRSAIIYLMNFVEIEENRKRAKFDGIIHKIFVDTTQLM